MKFLAALLCGLVAPAYAQELALVVPPLLVNSAITPTVECTAVNTYQYPTRITLTLLTADTTFPAGTTFSCSGTACTPVICNRAPLTTSCPGMGPATTTTPCPASTPCPTCDGASCDGTACWTGTTSAGAGAQVTCPTVAQNNACSIRALLPASTGPASVVLCKIFPTAPLQRIRASLMSLDANDGVHSSVYVHKEDTR